MSLIVVACGAAKRSQPCPAGEMYTGGFHKACRRAAEVLAGEAGRVMILSAKYGLLGLDQVIEPYNLRLGQPGSVSPNTVRTQAEGLGLLDTPVTALAGKDYANFLRKVFVEVRSPLAGSRGIGEMQARLAAIYR
ncbi:DUF6884 domain-containing protein [Spirillospora sp. CA-255316]